MVVDLCTATIDLQAVALDLGEAFGLKVIRRQAKAPMASLDASAPANATAFIKPSLVIPLDGKEATCSCFSEDGTWLAISYNSGAIETYRTQDGRLSFTLKSVAHKHPCTSVCFRPTEGKFSTKNVLISGDVGGQVHHWHATSGKHLGTIKELGNEIFTLAYQQTGEMFATAGLDTKIRIYDGMTRNISYVLEEGDGVSTTGHTNRVFCVKWSPIDDHVILSGGWDRTIQIWDVRVQKSVRSIFGPNLCGNSLDINDNTSRILTGSWRASEQLQEWDYGSGKLIGTFFWPTERSIEKACHIYSACYGRNMFQHLVVAGGSGSNQACLFNTKTGQLLGGLQKLQKGVVSISFNNKGTHMAITTTNQVFLVNMQEELMKL